VSFPSPRGLTAVCPPAQTLTKTLSCSKFALARRLAGARFAAAPGGRSLHEPTASPIYVVPYDNINYQIGFICEIRSRLCLHQFRCQSAAGGVLMPEFPLPARLANRSQDTGITYIFADRRLLSRRLTRIFPAVRENHFGGGAPKAPAAGAGEAVAEVCLASHTHAFAVRRPGPER
jgi:hypothetical protein